MRKKIIFTAIMSICLGTLPAYAAFDVGTDGFALTKNDGTEYSVSVTGQESSDGAMLVVYGDINGGINETISMNPEGSFKDYYIYYSRYFAKESNPMDINVKTDFPEEILGGNIYVSLISYDGTVKHISGVDMPGIKSAKSLKILLPDGTEAQSQFKVTAGNAYTFSAKVEDAYGNSFKASDLTYTLSGIDSSSVAMDKNSLIIDKKSDVYGKKFTVTAQLGDLSDTVEILVADNDSSGSGSGSGSGGGGGSKTNKTNKGGTVTLPATPSADVSVFADLDKDFWAYDSIMSLYRKGIVQGTGATVNPNGLITREEICALITRSCGLEPEDSRTEKLASDKTVSPWAVEYVSAAMEAGVLNGDSAGIAYGNSNATREQAFAILARAFSIAENNDTEAEFADMNSVSDWAKGYINAMYAKNIVKGTEGYIHPDDNITRAEFFAVLDRILK